MCDLLPASFTSWLSQELSYSQTCVVTIKHPQISIMKHSHTHLSLHNLQLTNANLQKSSMQQTFHFLSGSGSVTWLQASLCCLKAWSPTWQLTHNHQSVVSAPPPDLCTLTLTPAHHTAALNILTHGETGYFYCLWVWRIKLLKYCHCQA